MFKRAILVVFTIAIFSTYALGQLDAPKLDPLPSTEKQGALIKEGVALHDRGNYDAAISNYEEVLKENPSNVEALYEMSFSYSMKKEYRKALEAAYKGAQYKSRLLSAFYMQIGNNLDLLGEPKKAVEVYKAGIKLQPENALLYYNLAVTYRNLDKMDDARKTVKQALALNPNHNSSHLFLTLLWQEGGYKAPSLLSASRFLILEPRSQRSANALELVLKVMGGSATQGKNPNEINIFLDMNTKKDEGDFGSLEMVLGLGSALNMTEKNKGKTEMQLLVGQFETLFAIMSEQSDKGNKGQFAWQYYVPYFSELKRKNYVEPFVYYINQVGGSEEVQPWLAKNKGRVDEFLTWSKGYGWAKAK